MQDIAKVRKRRAQFDINNWDKYKSKRLSLITFTIASLKDDPLWKGRGASFEKYSHDEPEVKRQCLIVAPRL